MRERERERGREREREGGRKGDTQSFSDVTFFSENCSKSRFEDCTAWNGLNDLDIEGTFIWDHSNASLSFTNWHTGEPSVAAPAQAPTRDCGDIFKGGTWNDRTCSHLNWFICEKQFEQ